MDRNLKLIENKTAEELTPDEESLLIREGIEKAIAKQIKSI